MSQEREVEAEVLACVCAGLARSPLSSAWCAAASTSREAWACACEEDAAGEASERESWAPVLALVLEFVLLVMLLLSLEGCVAVSAGNSWTTVGSRTCATCVTPPPPP